MNKPHIFPIFPRFLQNSHVDILSKNLLSRKLRKNLQEAYVQNRWNLSSTFRWTRVLPHAGITSRLWQIKGET